jgi:hypothetical protein
MSTTGGTSTADLHPDHLDTGSKGIRPGAWRDEVKSRSTRLRTEARWLAVRGETLPVAAGDPMEIEIYKPLGRADELAGRDRLSFREWLSGSQVEECWRLLRQAEEGLFQLLPEAALPSRARAAEVHGLQVLGPEHPLMRTLRTELAKTSENTTALRNAALDVLRVAHETTDKEHRRIRSFRNQLLGLSTVLILLAAILVLGQNLLDVALVPPPNDATLSATSLLALIMFFGSVGALFSAVPSLATLPETSSPFNMSRQQAILKVVTGAWSAVLGLLVLNAGLAPSAPEVTSLGGLIVLAALFGAGQEALTRFADNKASGLLGAH